jgi:tetratricopeptide (TPR) repeat protein
MEDLVVGKRWQASLAAAVCAAGIGMETAQGSPAGMASSARRSAPAAPITSERVAGPPVANAASPSAWKRFTNALPEVHVPWGAKSKAEAPPARPVPNDASSLSSPTGPPTPELFISLAQLSEQRGDVVAARQHYQRALAQWPRHPEVLRAAARMEDRLGQWQLAESFYQQSVAARPGDPGALNDLALCLGRQGKLDQSIQVFEQAIHIQPDNARYRNNVATVLVETRQDQKAIAHLSAVHGPAETQFNMGQLLVARNRAAEAEPFFKAAVSANPDMKEATAALAQLTGRKPVEQVAQTPAPIQTAQTPAVAASSSPAATTPAAAQPTMPQMGPQIPYPAEARSPEYGPSIYGQSSFTPPPYQPPVGPYPGSASTMNPYPNVPWVGQATTRPLPPVGTPVRR